MTPAVLAIRVAYWQKRLEPLGLAHWKPEITIVEEPSNDAYTEAKAAVSCSSHYDTFWLEFRKEWMDGEVDLEELDKVIIHELIHVAMRDVDYEIEKVGEFLGVASQEIWEDSVKHAREGLVERLARTLYLTSR